MCVQLGPWISLSDPVSSSFGDEEPIANVIAASAVCDKPYEIECRTIVTKVDSSQVGQSVTCDLTHGLVCRNEDQSSYQCYNYEVRIKCWTCHSKYFLSKVMCLNYIYIFFPFNKIMFRKYYKLSMIYF